MSYSYYMMSQFRLESSRSKTRKSIKHSFLSGTDSVHRIKKALNNSQSNDLYIKFVWFFRFVLMKYSVLRQSSTGPSLCFVDENSVINVLNKSLCLYLFPFLWNIQPCNGYHHFQMWNHLDSMYITAGLWWHACLLCGALVSYCYIHKCHCNILSLFLFFCFSYNNGVNHISFKTSIKTRADRGMHSRDML